MATGLVGVAEASNRRTSSSGFLRFPSIRRQDIRWTGGGPASATGRNSPLAIELVFENPVSLPSAPATASVGVAPFGAFLPWKPLTRVKVPAIPPGGRRVVADTLGGDAPLPPPPSPGRNPPLSRVLASFRSLRPKGALSRLLSLSSLTSSQHFVGNLNVFVGGGAPVERHLQRSVGLRRGVENLALFLVGDGREDSYTFVLGEAEPGWDVRIPEVGWDEPQRIANDLIPLTIKPPERAESGRISILVRRGSTGQTVPVEFELEAGAPGSKCYHF